MQFIKLLFCFMLIYSVYVFLALLDKDYSETDNQDVSIIESIPIKLYTLQQYRIIE